VNTLVIDASVAAKWFLPSKHEPYADKAAALLKRYADGQVRFVVPDLFWAELGNTFWKAVRQGRWQRSRAEEAIRLAQTRSFPTISSKVLLEDAFQISTSFDRSVYDCFYVALAIASKATLVTADERLANALAAHLPVKWLGTMV
jgi:predicted nucleic acid-binding protein